VSVARFIADQRTNYAVPVALTCALLGISISWFYKWWQRALSPSHLSGNPGLETTRGARCRAGRDVDMCSTVPGRCTWIPPRGLNLTEAASGARHIPGRGNLAVYPPGRGGFRRSECDDERSEDALPTHPLVTGRHVFRPSHAGITRYLPMRCPTTATGRGVPAPSYCLLSVAHVDRRTASV